MPEPKVYFSMCGCGYSTPSRRTHLLNRVDKAWHDLTRHPGHLLRRKRG